MVKPRDFRLTANGALKKFKGRANIDITQQVIGKGAKIKEKSLRRRGQPSEVNSKYWKLIAKIKAKQKVIFKDLFGKDLRKIKSVGATYIKIQIKKIIKDLPRKTRKITNSFNLMRRNKIKKIRVCWEPLKKKVQKVLRKIGYTKFVKEIVIWLIVNSIIRKANPITNPLR